MSKGLKVCEDEASGGSIAQGSRRGGPGPLLEPLFYCLYMDLSSMAGGRDPLRPSPN